MAFIKSDAAPMARHFTLGACGLRWALLSLSVFIVWFRLDF
ncbi:hypothetical protein [Rhizobium rhizogenes]|nr:hypothetical protein [Rhizobium rhizogenes]